MVLVVEDGTGKPDANSYLPLVDFATYFSTLGDPAWAALTAAEQERHVFAATRYVNLQNIFPYDGHKSNPLQTMQWPRTDASYWLGGPDIPPAAVPIEVKQAVLEAARLSLASQLPTAQAPTAVGGREIKKEKVDVLEIEYFHSSQGKTAATSAAYGPDAMARFGDPNVLGLLIPLLHEDSTVSQQAGGFVTPQQASRRGGWFVPGNTPPAFERGMHDVNPLAEEKSRRRWP